MKFLPKNTLAHFNAAPQVHQHDLSATQTAIFSGGTLKYRANCGQTSPTDDAVSFYTLNHAASIVRKLFTENEVLPDWAQTILTTYTEVCMKQGERMLHYLLSITTREMRHLKSPHSAPLWFDLEKKFGLPVTSYIKDICSNGDETVAVNKYMKHPPAVGVGVYAKALAHAFHHGAWSGGYGGKAWGQVTDALVAMLTGETSMEMLVDTGYTLAHNGGPIFNKGMMYQHQDTGVLMTILDVQRSGQLLDLMLETNTLGVTKTADAIQAASLIKTHKPSEFKGYVDWKLVDELRPDKEKQSNPGKYVKVTTAQKQPAVKTKKIGSTAKPAKPAMATLLGKQVKVKGTWPVAPNQTVSIVERESA